MNESQNADIAMQTSHGVTLGGAQIGGFNAYRPPTEAEVAAERAHRFACDVAMIFAHARAGQGGEPKDFASAVVNVYKAAQRDMVSSIAAVS